MTKLEKLYSIMVNSKAVGGKLGKDVLEQVETLEEAIIKEEILQALSDDIAPRLEPIRRDLVLVVEYHPGEPISVALSRKTKISEIVGTKLMLPDPPVEHKKGTKREHPTDDRADKTVLRVTFPDGTVIADKKAKVTFVETIKRIGPMKVRSMGIKCRRVPLVSNTLDKRYGISQVPVGDGFYVITYSSTQEKKNQLDKISDQLHLGLKVEII